MQLNLRITELSISSQYGQRKMSTQPPPNTCLNVEIDDSFVTRLNDDEIILTVSGVKLILKEMEKVLVSGDF